MTENVLIAVDTHVHFYPFYNALLAFETAFRNLQSLQREALNLKESYQQTASTLSALLLTERAGDDLNAYLRASAAQLELGGVKVQPAAEAGSCWLVDKEDKKLLLITGRQIVTAERIEVLGLCCPRAFPDGLPLSEVLSFLEEQGAITVLNWSPGKWFGKRGEIVASLIDSDPTGKLFIGDTSLRPQCFREPLLIRLARKKGHPVLVGTDPLPCLLEEKYIGSFGMVCASPFDETQPLSSMRAVLRNYAHEAVVVGKRCGIKEALSRWLRNRFRSQQANT